MWNKLNQNMYFKKKLKHIKQVLTVRAFQLFYNKLYSDFQNLIS